MALPMDQKHQVVLDFLVSYIKGSLPEGLELIPLEDGVVTVNYPVTERHFHISPRQWPDRGEGFTIVLFNEHSEYTSELHVPLDMNMPDVYKTIETAYKYLDNLRDFSIEVLND